MSELYICDNNRKAIDLGVSQSADHESNLVLTGASRSITIRQIILYQVDDKRWLDPDNSLNAALSLFEKDE